MLIWLLLPTSYFVAQYSTTLLAKLYMICLVFDVNFWKIDYVFAKFAFDIFCLICSSACAETASPSGINIDHN